MSDEPSNNSPFNPTDETLLGYLLGGLSDEENDAIETWLTTTQDAQQRLRDLRSMLEPFASELNPNTRPDSQWRGNSEVASSTDCDIDDAVPSPGLVEGTLELIARSTATPLPSDERLSFRNRFAWFDSLATLATGIIFLSILLPGVWRWRELARQHECADNLRKLGSSLITFAHFQPSHRLPAIETDGPLSFAGVYAIRLRDSQLLDSQQWLQCPTDSVANWDMRIPTSRQFIDANESQREMWRFIVGGDYAYNMGAWVDGKYQAPALESPARVAWIGDRWPIKFEKSNVGNIDLGNRNSANTECAEIATDRDFEVHGFRSVNVLFSDGSVQALRLPKLDELVSIDHPYLNRQLQQAPGVDESDACLGPSYLLPAMKKVQPLQGSRVDSIR